MATYRIVPRQDGSGHDVGVIGNDGARHTMLGFKTEADAEEWIAKDRRADEAGGRESSQLHPGSGFMTAAKRLARSHDPLAFAKRAGDVESVAGD